MAVTAMPAIDQNVCGDWTEQQLNLYQALPYYLGKITVEKKQTWSTFSKLTKTRRWKQNQGPTFRGVITEPTPRLRQFANPRPVASQQPLTDVIDVRERTTEADVRMHDFESPIFNWYPEFNDFMSHIDDCSENIVAQVEIFNEVFLRGMMFHMAPFVFVAQADGSVKLIKGPYWAGTGQFNAAVHGKTAAFMADPTVQPSGPLWLSVIEQAMTIMETDLRVPFFRGSNLPKEDQPLDGKFLTIMDSEAWNRFIYDPLVKQNRSLSFDVLNNGYRGSFFGRSVTRLEDQPLRYKMDGTYVAPEIRQDPASTDYNAGETVGNPVYTQPDENGSPIGVAWIGGPSGYESIETGPPPSMFTGDKFPNSPKMDWSGIPRLTKNFLIECVDDAGVVQLKANTYGKFIKLITEQTFGILAVQRRNILPILYKRARGPGAGMV